MMEGGGLGSSNLHSSPKRPQVVDPQLQELLVFARRGNTSEVARLLGEAEEGGGADEVARVVDKHGRTCLHLAATHGHTDTALAILHSGTVDPNATNKRELTPLHDSCAEGHTHLTLLLLALGGNVMARTRDGWTPLMCACSNGHVGLAKLLEASGCEIDARTKLGLTALHIAAWKGHSRVVDALVRLGASAGPQDHNGKTPLQMATEEERGECARILQAATAKQSKDPVYRIAALEGEVRLCQEKIVEAHRTHDSLALKQHRRTEQLLEEMQLAHKTELDQAKSRIAELEEQIASLRQQAADAKSKRKLSQPTIKVEGSNGMETAANGTETLLNGTKTVALSGRSPNSNHKRKQRKQKTSMKTSEGRQAHGDGQSSQLTRSLSSTCLDEEGGGGGGGGGEGEGEGEGGGGDSVSVANTSLERVVHRAPHGSPGSTLGGGGGGGGEKLSITELVAESLKNPSCIAAIRKELKADGLTPKIKKKFAAAKKSTKATLPSLGGGGGPGDETSSFHS